RKNRTLIIIGIALLIALSLAYFLSAKNIINPLRQLQQLMEKAGKGDLTVYAQVRTKDEIQALGESFNQMITHQGEIVRQVRTSAQELAASSQEMAASSEQVSSATEQITASIQQVAKDADAQNNSVIEASKSLVQLASLVKLAQHKALSANERSANTMRIAQDGRTKVEETVQAMNIINEKSSDTAEVVQRLSKLSAKIGEIISTINAIAAQTDLLALNAAIEAARAGEHGRGFAVVADEVRKLSEESHKGASEIAALVSEMVKETNKAVESMRSGKEAVENGVKVVKATDQVFAEIIDAVEETVGNIQEIVEITKDEVATSDQVVNLINTIASISEATAANSQEVSAAAEEQASAVQTVAATAEETSAMANSLENLVRVFKLA
ncbi:MAG: methyl-accepting chemotaxis protein, partial [Bacillota bacterium]